MMAPPEAEARPDADRPDAARPTAVPSATVRALAACRDASARLLETLDGLDDPTARRPSRLPGWSVGHVVTHLARNADSHVRMVEGAMAGRVADQYERGLEGRAADIATGAGRPADQLIDDLRRAIGDLDAAWRQVTPEVWKTGHGRMGNGELCPCAQMPFRRWREVEIHRVDLGLGAEPVDWPEAYVELELPRALAQVPGRLSSADRATLLAWLVGRADVPPELPPW
jgi:maleylpyruvate isomerase